MTCTEDEDGVPMGANNPPSYPRFRTSFQWDWMIRLAGEY